MDNWHYMRISELLMYCYDGSASPKDIAELEALLDQNQPALEYCVDVSKAMNYFHCLAQVPLSQPESVEGLDVEFMSELEQQQQMDLLCDFAEYEKHADALEIASPEESAVLQPIKKIHFERPARRINKFSLGTAIVSVAALLLMVIYLRFAPPAPYEVATVSDSIDAEWSSDLPISSGTRIISNSEPIRLTRGIVKFQTDDQVDVVVEAPSEFYFSSYAEVSMNYGKLFAHVSEQGYGFSVVTPNSKIVDLGTEFGVLSHINGNTEVHLYRGKANVFAGEKHARKTTQLLHAGSALKVDSHNSNIEDIELDQQALVRNIDSKTKFIWKGQDTVRLTDLLLGGDGFGTASQQTIEYDPTTGAAVQIGTPGYRSGSGKISGISRSSYLDAIFVPGSGDGDTIVSSEGHCFLECPATSGLYYSNIICQKNCVFFDPVQQIFKDSRQQFDDPGFLYLHSNMGLTVDLNAVRRVVPGLRISSFSAFVGIIDMWNNGPDYSQVDVWVLVDGKVKSSQKAIKADQGYDIRVDISDADRFLSLVVTDGGQMNAEGFPANHFDTCGFAEPVFDVVSP